MLKPPSYTRVQKPLLHPPSLIAYKDIRILITDTPCVNNMPRYINEFKRWNVTDVVRLCKPTYSEDLLREHGIEVHDWLFTDGEPPPKAVIDDWLYLINSRLKQCDVEESKSEKPDEADESVEKHPCIAVHCVAGLGRAPVLVAIALIEEGMDPLDSIDLIRNKRRGAINNRQLKYLESYKRRKKSQQYGCWVS